MKILVPILNKNSGSVVYFQSLKNQLGLQGVSMELVEFPPCLESMPVLAYVSFWLRGGMDRFKLVHSNADYGVAFKTSNKPFIVTVHHNVVDERYPSIY